ncbi:hypothetical protein N9Y89_01415 [bacterium]|nr:hypothetical protein [bacterium]
MNVERMTVPSFSQLPKQCSRVVSSCRYHQIGAHTPYNHVWKGIAQDALVMNLDDLLCVGVSASTNSATRA